MGGRGSGYGVHPVNLKNADIEIPKINSLKKIAKTGVLVPTRIYQLGKNPQPLEKSKGAINLKSLFSDKPDPSVHKHRLKRRAMMAEQECKGMIVAAKEKNAMLMRKKDIAVEARDIQNLARQFAFDAMQALVDILRNPDSSDSSKITAANTLLDRGYGKAAMTTFNVNANLDAKPKELDGADLDKRIAEAITNVEKKLSEGRDESIEKVINIKDYN